MPMGRRSPMQIRLLHFTCVDRSCSRQRYEAALPGARNQAQAVDAGELAASFDGDADDCVAAGCARQLIEHGGGKREVRLSHGDTAVSAA
jgi:hypothetical protein